MTEKPRRLNKMIIVSAPSGAGKTTLCDRAIKDFSQLRDSISFTTRTARTGESEGQPYYFISTEKFESLIKEDFFAEWAKVHDKYYGTSQKQLEEIWAEGNTVIMDVDVQGAENLKKKYPQATRIFIMPPSMDALRHRISGRDKGTTNNIDLRLKNAQMEIREAKKFEYCIINEDVERAYREFKKIIEEILKHR